MRGDGRERYQLVAKFQLRTDGGLDLGFSNRNHQKWQDSRHFLEGQLTGLSEIRYRGYRKEKNHGYLPGF